MLRHRCRVVPGGQRCRMGGSRKAGSGGLSAFTAAFDERTDLVHTRDRAARQLAADGSWLRADATLVPARGQAKDLNKGRPGTDLTSLRRRTGFENGRKRTANDPASSGGSVGHKLRMRHPAQQRTRYFTGHPSTSRQPAFRNPAIRAAGHRLSAGDAQALPSFARSSDTVPPGGGGCSGLTAPAAIGLRSCLGLARTACARKAEQNDVEGNLYFIHAAGNAAGHR